MQCDEMGQKDYLHSDKRRSKEGEKKGKKKVVEAWIFTPEITMAV